MREVRSERTISAYEYERVLKQDKCAGICSCQPFRHLTSSQRQGTHLLNIAKPLAVGYITTTKRKSMQTKTVMHPADSLLVRF